MNDNDVDLIQAQITSNLSYIPNGTVPTLVVLNTVVCSPFQPGRACVCRDRRRGREPLTNRPGCPPAKARRGRPAGVHAHKHKLYHPQYNKPFFKSIRSTLQADLKTQSAPSLIPTLALILHPRYTRTSSHTSAVKH